MHEIIVATNRQCMESEVLTVQPVWRNRYASILINPAVTTVTVCCWAQSTSKTGWPTLNTVPERILCRHWQRTEAVPLLMCCSSCVDTVYLSSKLQQWVSLSQAQERIKMLTFLLFVLYVPSTQIFHIANCSFCLSLPSELSASSFLPFRFGQFRSHFKPKGHRPGEIASRRCYKVIFDFIQSTLSAHNTHTHMSSIFLTNSRRSHWQ